MRLGLRHRPRILPEDCLVVLVDGAQLPGRTTTTARRCETIEAPDCEDCSADLSRIRTSQLNAGSGWERIFEGLPAEALFVQAFLKAAFPCMRPAGQWSAGDWQKSGRGWAHCYRALNPKA